MKGEAGSKFTYKLKLQVKGNRGELKPAAMHANFFFQELSLVWRVQ